MDTIEPFPGRLALVARIGCAWLSLVVATTPLLLPANQVLAQARRPAQAANPGPQEAIGGLQLKVRRLPDAVELVLEQAGLGASLTQQPLADRWQGDLRTDRPRALKVGPQSLALPAEGFERISFEGSGENFRLTVTPVAGRPLASPVISSDGRDLVVSFPAQPNVLSQTARPNLRQPTPVPIESFVPPLRPRAVAPPLGDMAVGTMTLKNRGFLNVSGPPVTLTTRGANPRDVLMVLAQMGRYGFAYSDLQPQRTKQGTDLFGQRADIQASTPDAKNSEVNSTILPRVTVFFKNEPFSRAFNFVLASSGLQARLEGRTILVGAAVLQQSLGAQVSKVYRLNQASADSAADYLANLGALVTKTFQETITTTEGVLLAGASTANPQTNRTSKMTKVLQYGGERGPLLGLQATTDIRLGTITVIGEAALVAFAQEYLRQLDLRQRQVALSVKILDVNLSNDTEIDNSFAFRFGNNFIVNDSGQLLGAFGRNLPPNEAAFDRQSSGPLESVQQNSSNQSSTSLVIESARNLELSRSQLRNINTELQNATGFRMTEADKRLVVSPIDSQSSTMSDRTQRSIERIISRNIGRNVSTRRSSSSESNSSVSGTLRPNPGSLYSDDTFFNFVRAQIESSNTKILANPTLILQEGGETYGEDSDAKRVSADGKIGRSRSNEAYVRVGTQYVTAYDIKQDINGNIFCQPVFGNAGLTFGAKVDKIDDNGFVTFGLSPEISAPVGSQRVGNCGDITLINDRLLDTGKLRVRDGQTLILTGVISETDRSVVTKWPILGDIPLIGQFFRRSGSERTKNELVIMVTPRIINDDQGGAYGYGFQPSTEDGRRMIYGTGAP